MSYHSLTCDPDCCYGDCACDCFCHPTEADMLMPGTSNLGNQSAVRFDTEGEKKAPGANRGQPTTTSKESK